jgi:hypothetical protein
MGILGKILAGKMVMNAVKGARAESSAAGASAGQYIPAGAAESTAISRTGTAILDKAGRFYKENPRKVQALGLLAAAMLLSRVKQRGRMF